MTHSLISILTPNYLTSLPRFHHKLTLLLTVTPNCRHISSLCFPITSKIYSSKKRLSSNSIQIHLALTLKSNMLTDPLHTICHYHAIRYYHTIRNKHTCEPQSFEYLYTLIIQCYVYKLVFQFAFRLCLFLNRFHLVRLYPKNILVIRKRLCESCLIHTIYQSFHLWPFIYKTVYHQYLVLVLLYYSCFHV